MLLRKLADAIRVDSVADSGFVVTQICRDIADLTGVGEETQAQLAAAVSDAERWLEKQSHMRRWLFSELAKAINTSDLVRVRTLRKRIGQPGIATGPTPRTRPWPQLRLF
ncbi:hypothetical protein ABZ642_41915 [Streptomyces sp. NPDC007157]|uniref:hypothetical protein n=1 Tax=Streptomyces sp. NPDC007157 TaxID=3154681 RepID=UPI0033FDBDC9